MPSKSNKLIAAMAAALPVLLLAQPLLAADEENKPGLLDFNVVQVLWVLFIFIVLVVILKRTAWNNVLQGLDTREKRIRKDIADAEAARLKAEATLKEYTAKIGEAEGQIRDMLTNARAEADKIATGVRMNAQQEAEEIKERASKDIEAAKTTALSEIYQQTADLATLVAEKIIRRNLNADDQRELVSQSLDQLQRMGSNN